jgi:hypothetical protein
MFSINEWVVQGNLVESKQNKKGYWLKVKGVAKNDSSFKSDNYNIDCWVSNRVLGNKQIKDRVKLFGRFKFEKDECYFIADNLT